MASIINGEMFGDLLKVGIRTVAAGKKVNITQVDEELAAYFYVGVNLIRLWKTGNLARLDDDYLYPLVWWMVTQSNSLDLNWMLQLLNTTSVAGLLPKQIDQEWLLKFFITHSKNDQALVEQTVARLLPSKSNNAELVRHWSTRTPFVGRTQEIATLTKCLEKRPAFVYITGLGGIGKTALAHECAAQCLKSNLFAHIVWISAKQEIMHLNRIENIGLVVPTSHSIMRDIAQQANLIDPHKVDEQALQKSVKEFLHATSTLLILDNFEVVTDVDKLIAWLDLNLFAGSSSAVLITSRHRIDYQFLQRVELTGFSDAEDSIQLIRSLAEEKNITALLNGDDDDLATIHRITGGSPLAMTLIIGLMTIYEDLREVLNELQKATSGGDSEGFYRFVYFSIWKQLSKQSKLLLIDLARLPANQGETRDIIEKFSAIRENVFDAAMRQLRQFSLVEVRYQKLTPWYMLHPLTQYFVLGDIVGKW